MRAALLALLAACVLSAAAASTPAVSAADFAINPAQAVQAPPARPARRIAGGAYNVSAPISFQYGKSKVYGVNLGGWLVLEPWITPSLFSATGDPSIIDEFTYGQKLGAAQATKNLQKHWSTFYSANDFTAIKAAGLNHVRLPVGAWAIDPTGTPYATGQWPFVKQAVLWAKAAGLFVWIDLHGAIGSQNGFDNSGQKTQNWTWFDQPSNIDRTLSVLKTFATEFRDPKYGGAVTGIDILNEPKPQSNSTRQAILLNFYERAYAIVHAPGNPYLFSMHYAYIAFPFWRTFMPKSSWRDVSLATHIYQLFMLSSLNITDAERISRYCAMKQTLVDNTKVYTTIVGEWSPAITDCTTDFRGRGVASTYGTQIGSCKGLTGDASKFSADYKTRLRKSWEVQARVYSAADGHMQWTWKTETAQAEEFSYQAAIKYGWAPATPTSYLYPDPCGNAAPNQAAPKPSPSKSNASPVKSTAKTTKSTTSKPKPKPSPAKTSAVKPKTSAVKPKSTKTSSTKPKTSSAKPKPKATKKASSSRKTPSKASAKAGTAKHTPAKLVHVKAKPKVHARHRSS